MARSIDGQASCTGSLPTIPKAIEATPKPAGSRHHEGNGANMRESIRKSTGGALGLAFASTFALACAGMPGPVMPDSSVLADAPDWVLQSCSAYWGDDDGARICGVGSAGGTKNISLARNAAIGRARTEIARSLQVKVKSMLKDYQATTTGGDEFLIAAADEQYVEDVSKQITNMTLSGTAMQDTWVAHDGTMFTLVALDIDTFKDSLKSMTDLSETIRRAVKERADSSFRELDEVTQ
jgi:hypothetical protein